MTDELVSLEADPASLRATAEDLRVDVDAMATAASNVHVDATGVAGSAIAAVLAQVGPVVSASIESASTRLLQFTDHVEQSAAGYEQADVEFADALKNAVALEDVRGQVN